MANWEQLQQEKQQQKSRFEAELQGLQAKQRVELRALEEQLSVRHMEENESLQAQHQCELEELRFKQQELVRCRMLIRSPSVLTVAMIWNHTNYLLSSGGTCSFSGGDDPC